MNQLQVIKTKEILNQEVKVYETAENPIFVAKEVAEWIDYSYKDSRKVNRNVSKMLQMVDEEEKIKSTLKLGGWTKVNKMDTKRVNVLKKLSKEEIELEWRFHIQGGMRSLRIVGIDRFKTRRMKM